MLYSGSSTCTVWVFITVVLHVFVKKVNRFLNIAKHLYKIRITFLFFKTRNGAVSRPHWQALLCCVEVKCFENCTCFSLYVTFAIIHVEQCFNIAINPGING